MALIKRTFTVCNKCGRAAENVGTNILIMDEEFYLCDDCMEKLFAFFSDKEEDNQVIRQKPHPITGRTCTYMKWDEYNLDKLVNLYSAGNTQKDIADEFRVKLGSIQNIIKRIRESTPGQTLYPYRKFFVEESDEE